MADEDNIGVSLYARHLPDTVPDSHPRPDTVELGAGLIEVGVEINGHRRSLAVFKADDILSRSDEQPQTPAG